MPSKTQLYFNTVKRLRPGMIVSRLRGSKVLSIRNLQVPCGIAKIPAISIPELDCDEAFAARFDIDALSDDCFRVINETRKVDLGVWNDPKASHLWNFNLHYFEYCVPLAARFAKSGDWSDWETFKRLILSWMDTCVYPKGDAWHPYTISLRLVNWLICLDLFEAAAKVDNTFLRRLSSSMYLQYRYLLVNQETHLLGNHYFENLKTLLICSLMFDERDVFARVNKKFENQLNEQILPDGVHYERSLMYHKLVLEGLLRVELAVRSIGDAALPKAMRSKEQLMLDAMTSLEKGMGKTPFFNDSADGVAKECDQLVVACDRVLSLKADDSKADFPCAGYYKLYEGEAALMLDAGEPGPKYMLGHAHCDCLSYELSLSNSPVIVNSGTYAYQSDLRPYFRSTGAHNTVFVDEEEQLECWGEHRVARGYRKPWAHRVSPSLIEAGFTSPNGRRIRRRIELYCHKLHVVDEVDGSPCRMTSFIHFESCSVNEFPAVVYAEMGGAVLESRESQLSFIFTHLKRGYCCEVSNESSNHLDFEIKF